MATIREAILEGAKEAGRLHDELDIRHTVEASGAGIDVFGTLLQFGVELIFRPLDGLLGAFLSQPASGVVISTQRPLHIQRFTGAHELGHVVLGHEASLDGEEILIRDIRPKRRWGKHELLEIAADAFAAAFLIPLWLLQMHGRRQGWNRDSMRDPTIVYQLSLRVGASYEATCRALQTFKIVDEAIFHTLIATQPKTIKQRLLEGHELDNWYSDVWVLTDKDEGATLEGSPNDLFVLKLHEKSGAGYLWNMDELHSSGFAIIRDERLLDAHQQEIGGPVTRRLIAQSDNVKAGRFVLEHRRPWQTVTEPLERLTIRYDLWGKEEGLPWALRRELRAA